MSCIEDLRCSKKGRNSSVFFHRDFGGIDSQPQSPCLYEELTEGTTEATKVLKNLNKVRRDVLALNRNYITNRDFFKVYDYSRPSKMMMLVSQLLTIIGYISVMYLSTHPEI